MSKVSAEEYYRRYLERYPDNRFNLTVETFNVPLMLTVMECAVHGTKFQIEPYYLVRPTNHTYGCKECGRERSSKSFQCVDMSEQANTEKWQNSEYREIHSARSSRTLKSQWQDSEFRKIQSRRIKALWQDPEHREKMSKVLASNGNQIDGPSKDVLHIASILQHWDINYQGGDDMENEFTIPDTLMRYDFYLPEFEAFIEFHGKQHYEYTPYFHKTERDFLDGQDRDAFKVWWAHEHSYGLLVIDHDEINDAENRICEFLGLN